MFNIPQKERSSAITLSWMPRQQKNWGTRCVRWLFRAEREGVTPFPVAFRCSNLESRDLTSGRSPSTRAKIGGSNRCVSSVSPVYPKAKPECMWLNYVSSGQSSSNLAGLDSSPPSQFVAKNFRRCQKSPYVHERLSVVIDTDTDSIDLPPNCGSTEAAIL